MGPHGSISSDNSQVVNQLDDLLIQLNYRLRQEEFVTGIADSNLMAAINGILLRKNEVRESEKSFLCEKEKLSCLSRVCKEKSKKL